MYSNGECSASDAYIEKLWPSTVTIGIWKNCNFTVFVTVVHPEVYTRPEVMWQRLLAGRDSLNSSILVHFAILSWSGLSQLVASLHESILIIQCGSILAQDGVIGPFARCSIFYCAVSVCMMYGKKFSIRHEFYLPIDAALLQTTFYAHVIVTFCDYREVN